MALSCAVLQSSSRPITIRGRRTRRNVVRPAGQNFNVPSPDKILEKANVSELKQDLLDFSQFGKRGEGLVAAQTALILLTLFEPGWFDKIGQVAGGLSLVGGLSILYVGTNDLGPGLTPLSKPREGCSLAKDGVYSYVRHPMYSGLLLTALGVSLLAKSPGRLGVTFLLYLVLESKMEKEEEELKKRFDEYEEYANRVPRLIPKRSKLLEGRD